MNERPYPYWIFELWCKAAAEDYVAQDDVVTWSPLRRKVTRFFAGIAMEILGLFWTWR